MAKGQKLNIEKDLVDENLVDEVEEKVVSDAELDKMSKESGEALKQSEKIKIKIPIDKLNPEDLYVPVCISGYIYQIERGKSVEVPEAVSDILSEAGYI